MGDSTESYATVSEQSSTHNVSNGTESVQYDRFIGECESNYMELITSVESWLISLLVHKWCLQYNLYIHLAVYSVQNKNRVLVCHKVWEKSVLDYNLIVSFLFLSFFFDETSLQAKGLENNEWGFQKQNKDKSVVKSAVKSTVKSAVSSDVFFYWFCF